MSSPALDLDLATLVGELEDVPCEHSQHATRIDQHTDEPASHYVQFQHEACGHSTVYAACPGFISHAAMAMAYDLLVGCRGCRAVVPADAALTILGPVNGRAS